MDVTHYSIYVNIKRIQIVQMLNVEALNGNQCAQ